MKLKKTSQVSPQTAKPALSRKKLKQGGVIVSTLLLLICSFFLQKYLNQPRVLTSQAAEYTTSPTSYYGRFAEENVFNFSNVSQIYGFFTTNHYQVTRGNALPSGATLSGGRLTFGSKGGVIIENPLKDEPFYRIDFEIEDTGQTNVQGTVNFMEGLWTPVDKSGAYPVVRDNIASVGIDTSVCSYAYSYNDTELMNEYLRLSASGNSAERAKATFSQNNLSRFAKRHNGDIKVSYFVTPIGSYAMVDGVNFSNLPSLYTGDYLLNKGKRINYITFARFNESGDPITFKNLKITRLDNGVDTMEEALVYFVKDFYESGKLEVFKKNALAGATGSGTGGGVSFNFSTDGGTLLFAASAYRFYDYYFGTNHVEEVRSLYNTYISIYEVYAKNEMDSFKASTAGDRWDSYNFEFRKTHYHPLLTYALSGYLTQEQLLRARNIYSQVVDLVMEKIISLDKDTPFVDNNRYIGDTKAEEFWNLNYLVGYLVLFPEDKIRSQYLKDYINFEGFVMLSDGRSMKDYYGSTFSFDFLPENYLNYRMKNIHSDGNLDQHNFHPSLNYASACASIPNLKNLLGKNGLEFKSPFR